MKRHYEERRNFDLQAQNPDLVIPAGGKAPLQAMFAQAKSFKWDGIGSYHDGYQTPDTGRVVVLDDGDSGVDCHLGLDNGGRSVGVAPEALKARSADAKKSPLEGMVSLQLPRNFATSLEAGTKTITYKGRTYDLRK